MVAAATFAGPTDAIPARGRRHGWPAEALPRDATISYYEIAGNGGGAVPPGGRMGRRRSR